MNKRKQQKDIDKAIANLIKYSDSGVWEARQAQFFDEVLSGVAESLEVPADKFYETLEDHGYMETGFVYLFELFASTLWDNEEDSMISNYIKRRGWRETPYAKRYLSALDDSEVQLWEIVDVNAGYWVNVRPVGSTSKTMRIDERLGSQSLEERDCIAARVISLDDKYRFGGGILLFSKEQAQEIPTLLSQAQEHVIKSLKQLSLEKQDCQWSDEDILAIAEDQMQEKLPELLFVFWASQTYVALTMA